MSGHHWYPTYWNQEAPPGRPMFMYWQFDKGRHAITPQVDPLRSDLPLGDLFPQVRGGIEEPGIAFYRPVPHNEWYEFDMREQRWFDHPQERNIQYAQLTRDQA